MRREDLRKIELTGTHDVLTRFEPMRGELCKGWAGRLRDQKLSYVPLRTWSAGEGGTLGGDLRKRE